jgi:hypothetical protein
MPSFTRKKKKKKNEEETTTRQESNIYFVWMKKRAIGTKLARTLRIPIATNAFISCQETEKERTIEKKKKFFVLILCLANETIFSRRSVFSGSRRSGSSRFHNLINLTKKRRFCQIKKQKKLKTNNITNTNHLLFSFGVHYLSDSLATSGINVGAQLLVGHQRIGRNLLLASRTRKIRRHQTLSHTL